MGRVKSGIYFAHEIAPPEAWSSCYMGDLVELGVDNTLQYDPYEDELQNVAMFPFGMKSQK